ncbi:hypothetical protein E3P77_01343 [Wallemia ichthyophaga]|nr:hypothetical protein E3P77_01343 [Wallemia ichthyophaga]
MAGGLFKPVSDCGFSLRHPPSSPCNSMDLEFKEEFQPEMKQEEEQPETSASAVPGAATTAAATPPSAPAENTENPHETIYIRNLNETIRLATLKESLRNLYSNIGEVVDVIAHRNIRMRGQAFVAFNSAHVAKRAVNDTQNLPLYGQPMKVSFARSTADAVLRRQKKAAELEAHLSNRKAAKPLKRKENYIRLMQLNRAKAQTNTGEAGEGDPSKSSQSHHHTNAQKHQQMPDEYLPPNTILFIQNLPPGTPKEKLEEVFGMYPNLAEVRVIPARPDIAFVEYLDEASSAVAKDALNEYHVEADKPIKVTFARK